MIFAIFVIVGKNEQGLISGHLQQANGVSLNVYHVASLTTNVII